MCAHHWNIPITLKKVVCGGGGDGGLHHLAKCLGKYCVLGGGVMKKPAVENLIPALICILNMLTLIYNVCKKVHTFFTNLKLPTWKIITKVVINKLFFAWKKIRLWLPFRSWTFNLCLYNMSYNILKNCNIFDQFQEKKSTFKLTRVSWFKIVIWGTHICLNFVCFAVKKYQCLKLCIKSNICLVFVFNLFLYCDVPVFCSRPFTEQYERICTPSYFTPISLYVDFNCNKFITPSLFLLLFR
jgi:hypothetical protein